MSVFASASTAAALAVSPASMASCARANKGSRAEVGWEEINCWRSESASLNCVDTHTHTHTCGHIYAHAISCLDEMRCVYVCVCVHLCLRVSA